MTTNNARGFARSHAAYQLEQAEAALAHTGHELGEIEREFLQRIVAISRQFLRDDQKQHDQKQREEGSC